MGYREIEVKQKYTVRCRDCNKHLMKFEHIVDSAGEAERIATNHIEDDSNYGAGLPYLNHVLEITVMTLVGREI